MMLRSSAGFRWIGCVCGLLLTLTIGAPTARAQGAEADAPEAESPAEAPVPVAQPEPDEAGGAGESDEFDLEELRPTRAAPEVDEITITGSANTITNVQDEASAVTAFSMDDLDKANITNVETLAFNVPSLHVGLLGNQVIVTLRGIGTQNASANGEPGVAFIVDDVNYLRPVSAQVAFFDLEGVEVLRGPQGTKGGKNSTSGWINVSTRKPSDDFEFNLDVQNGSFDEMRYRGALNLPVNEYARFRVSGIYHERDGYIDNIFLDDDDKDPFDVEDWGLRTHFELLPTENLRSLFSYNYYQQGGVGPQVNILPNQSHLINCPSLDLQPERMVVSQLPDPLVCASVANFLNGFRVPAPPVNTLERFRDEPWFGLPSATRQIAGDGGAILRADQIEANTPASRDNRFWGFTSTTTWDMPSFSAFEDNQLKFIGSFQKVETNTSQDFDGVDITRLLLDVEEDTDQTSGEIQWTSTLGANLNLQASGFYQQLKSDGNFNIKGPDGLELTTGQLRFDDPTPGVQYTENDSYGLALHSEYLISDSLTFQLGGRYSKDVRSVNLVREQADTRSTGGLQIELCTGGAGQSPSGALIPVDLEALKPPPVGQNAIVEFAPPTCTDKFRHTTGSAKLEWRPWEEQLFYVGVGNGYKGGGYANQSFGQYEPEFIKAYTVGAKNSFFDGRLTTSAEAFFYDYKDLQIVNIDGVKLKTENADARVMGVDLEATATPIDGMELGLRLGHLNAKVTRFLSVNPTDRVKAVVQTQCELSGNPFACPASDSFKGNSLSRSPEWTLQLSAQQTFYLDQFGSITPRIQYYWQDDTYYRIYNEPRDLQEAYHVTDVKVTWNSPSEAWAVEAFLNNIENDYIYQNVLVGPRLAGSPLNAWYGSPRLWGLRAQYRY